MMAPQPFNNPFAREVEPEIPVAPELQSFLEGRVLRWAGNENIIKRRGQVPSPSFSPRKVVFTVLSALKVNDEPQINHGALVLLTFSSPTGDIGKSKLDPGELASFIRKTFPELLDFRSAELVGDEPRTIVPGQRLVQSVVVSTYDSEQKATFDIYLGKHGELWLIDVILRQ